MTAQTCLLDCLYSPVVPPATEVQAKRAGLDRAAGNHRAELERAARFARSVFYRKEAAGITSAGVVTVCMDEVRAAAGIVRDTTGERRNNYLGSVFTARMPGKRKWQVVPMDMHRSRTDGSHANRILYWTLMENRWPE